MIWILDVQPNNASAFSGFLLDYGTVNDSKSLKTVVLPERERERERQMGGLNGGRIANTHILLAIIIVVVKHFFITNQNSNNENKHERFLSLHTVVFLIGRKLVNS